MADDIFIIQDNRTLIEMNEKEYDSEELLQSLLADYPKLLAGGQIDNVSPRRWLLIKREVGVPAEDSGGDRWSVDHLFLDQDAIPTIVEVKRSCDTRIRREVVGQMLDYAANAVVYWTVENLQLKFQKNSDDPERWLAEFLGEGGDPEAFWLQVKDNLQTGKVRMLFVADVIPNELRTIVEFLNKQMDPAEVLAVEIKQYVGQGIKTLVPRVMGQTAEAEVKKKKSPGRKLITDEARLAFWTALCATVVEQAPQLAPGTPTDGAVMPFLSGDPDQSITCRAERNGNKLAVVLKVAGPDAQANWERLKHYLEQSGGTLGNAWQCGKGKGGQSFLGFTTARELNIESKDQWPQQHRWVVDAVMEIQKSLIPLIKTS